jgi:predicted amidohydrolase
VTPAKVLKREHELGTLRPGAVADIVVSDLLEGEFIFIDSLQEERRGRQKLVTKTVIASGEVYDGPVYEPGEMKHRVQGPPEYLRAAAPALVAQG